MSANLIADFHGLHQLFRLMIPNTLPWRCFDLLKVIDAELRPSARPLGRGLVFALTLTSLPFSRREFGSAFISQYFIFEMDRNKGRVGGGECLKARLRLVDLPTDGLWEDDDRAIQSPIGTTRTAAGFYSLTIIIKSNNARHLPHTA